MILDLVRRDIAYGVRSLRRTPGFTAAVVLTIALGVGANAAVFSMVDGVLLRALPFEAGDRLVVIHQLMAASGAEDIGLSVLEVADYRRQSQTLDGVAEYHSMYFNLFGRGEARRVQTGVVSADFFPVVGVRPAIGRLFTASDDQPAAPPVLVLSYGFWQRVFGGDRAVIGTTVEMNDRVHTIVGVLPPLPPWPDANEVFMPASACPFRSAPNMLAARDMRMVGAIGRLRPDVPVSQATAELATLARGFAKAYPKDYQEPGFTAAAVSAGGLMAGQARTPFLVLLGATLFVLLLVCANIATLMLARLRARDRELAVRAALGASRGRLLGQLVVESLLMSLAGGAFGVVLAAFVRDMLVSYAARFSPRAAEIAIDGRVLLFALAVSAGAGVTVALVAGLGRHEPIVPALKDGSAASTRRRGGVRSALVAAQVAISFVLLVGAGLLTRSLIKLEQVDPGFKPDHVLSMRIDLDWTRYNDDQKKDAFYRRLLEHVERRPGVLTAALSLTIPLNQSAVYSQGLTVEGRQSERGRARPLADFRKATPGYFNTVGVPLVRGRFFSDRDCEGEPIVAIVNESLVRHRFGGEDPISRRVSFDGGERWITVVGVVGDVHQYGLDKAPADEVYLPLFQAPSLGGTLLVRTAGDPLALAADIRQVVRGLDVRQPVVNVRSLEQVRDDSLASRKLTAGLIGLFALLALAVTCAGVIGVVAFHVSQRTHEIGIRMALGADRSGLVRMMVLQAMMPVVVGLAIGSFGALALSGALRGLLFEIRPTDPGTFVLGLAVLAGAAALACLAPARRAAAVSPLEALREG
jgi:putative ABC transport system permease protein